MTILATPKRRIFDGMRAGQLATMLRVYQQIKYKSNEVIFRQGDPGECMYVILAGRIKITAKRNGEDVVVGYLEQGEFFGEMSLLLDQDRSATVTTVMDTRVLQIDRDAFNRLNESVPQFASTMCATLAGRLRRQQQGAKPEAQRKVVGLLYSSPIGHQVIQQLAASLSGFGEAVRIVTDNDIPWPATQSHRVLRLNNAAERCDLAGQLHQHLTALMPRMNRVLVARNLAEEADFPCTIHQCETIFWLVEPKSAKESRQQLAEILHQHPDLAPRVQLVWVLSDSPQAPKFEHGLPIHNQQFKISVAETGAVPRQPKQSIDRLVRHLRNTQVAVALGGGGALGLAHLGALRAFERAGIFVDRISGTSMGALVGLAYASGWDPDFALAAFKRELTPSPVFQCLPRGKAWYLFWKFQTRGWDAMLRPYFSDFGLEQLPLPLSTVAVDLIRGQEVVRDKGDAISAVLESINLPGVSRPILKDGMALTDGGVLNNVPTSVLRSRGADIVIGIDVLGSLPQRFGAMTPKSLADRRTPGYFGTMSRVREVRKYSTRAAGPKCADTLISIDTSDFSFYDFTKAHELAEVGELAAEQAIPGIREKMTQFNA